MFLYIHKKCMIKNPKGNIDMTKPIDGQNDNSFEYTGIKETTKNKNYQNMLEQKINSILDGKETISVEQLKKNSLFSNLSDKALERFNDIAGLDGDNTTFNADELKVLYAMADASLKDNKFVFDGEFAIDKNSGLEEATDKEVAVFKQNLGSNALKHLQKADTSKYSGNKTFTERVASDDVNESMYAVQQKIMTDYTDPNTGENLSITQIIARFDKFEAGNSNNVSGDYYKEIAKAFTQETGIPVSDYDQYRNSTIITVGDWRLDASTLTNTKTGEELEVNHGQWGNTTDHTVPAADGYFCSIKSYNDGQGTSVKYTYGDDENLAPTGSAITLQGDTTSHKFDRQDPIDPDLYGFVE